MNKFGRLETVSLRDHWKNEATNFTNWLAEKESLDLLGETIGISLEIEEREAAVGSFYADILAKDENGDYVIIENQLEATDHSHLGQIIAYASGKEAKTIVWIAKKFRDEFRKAIEWLNQHTDDDINFFAIEIELWKIGDSVPAPKFSIIEKPNEWAKIIKDTGKIKGKTITETELKRLDFWANLIDYATENNISIFTQKPSKDHWYNVPIGTSGVYLSLTVLFSNNKITCSFYIYDNKALYDNLETYKNEIENDFGHSLIWNRKQDNVKSASIYIEKEIDFEEDVDNVAYKWMTDNAVEFKKIFVKYLKKINP